MILGWGDEVIGRLRDFVNVEITYIFYALVGVPSLRRVREVFHITVKELKIIFKILVYLM